MKKKTLLILFLSCVFFVGMLTSSAVAQLIENGYYKITVKHSGKSLDVRNGSTSNGADVIQYSYDGDDNQIWLVQYDPEDEAYLLIAKHSNRCIDITGGSTSLGADAIQYDWNEGDNQKFYITSLGSGYYKFTAKHSGKVLEVKASSYLNGAAVQQWSWNGGNNQRWKMTKLNIPYPGETGSGGDCATQYPVILIHGVAMGDNTLGYQYFGRVPNYLRSYGANVEGGEQDAWDDSYDNADQIKEKIENVMDAYNVDKVNIIAHSKGAIDTRAMFDAYPYMKNHVASFTSVATPARGSVLATIILGAIPDAWEPYVGRIINVIGLIVQGDESPASLEAANQLLPDVMADFNADLGDLDSGIDGVYCQSYGAKIKGVVLDVALQATGVAMTIGGESPNDGAVWVESAEYANFKGIESGASWCGGVTHFGIVDRGILVFPGFTPGFNAREFYREIVSDLKNRGY